MKVLRRFGKRFEQWLSARSWLDIPAVLGLFALLACGITLKFWNRTTVLPDYAKIARRALAMKDYQTARVACRRLLVGGDERRAQNLFEMAVALGNLGRGKEANAYLRMAAPTDKPGYPQAHLFTAASLLSGTAATAATAKLAEVHLGHVLTIEPDNDVAHELLGRIEFQRGNWAAAKKQFAAAAGKRPAVMFALAAAAERSGDSAEAREWATRAEKYFSDQVAAQKWDDSNYRLDWVRALVLQKRFAEAAATIEGGLKKAASKQYRDALADLYAVWARQVAADTPGDVARRIELITKGLSYGPAHAELLELMLALSHGDGPEAATAREAVTKILADGGNSANLHFIAGNDAWTQGDVEGARTHWALAYELAPETPLIANNMAMVLTFGKHPDPERALDIIDSAVAKLPEEPNLRDTRGQILIKLGRWQDAVKDLEFALTKVADPRTTHAALAKAYRELGLTDLADEHQRRADAMPPKKP